MPTDWVAKRNGEKGGIEKYHLPYWLTLDPEKINTTRTRYAALRDDLIGYQKECGKRGDREGARFFKEEAAHALKTYRAACLMLGQYGSKPLPGDSPTRDTWDWPQELFPHIVFVERTCEA